MNRKSKIGKYLAAGFLAASLFGIWFYKATYLDDGLHVEWEGALAQLNFRDVGASINHCYEQESEPGFRFNNGVLLRANKFFSGWPCRWVGDPDEIFSLNHRAGKSWAYFCVKENSKVLASHSSYSKPEIVHLETLEDWEDATKNGPICNVMAQVLTTMSASRSALVHCDAGRDRTGALAAMLSALVIEAHQGSIHAGDLAAIECDYRRSQTLAREKWGMMATLLTDVKFKTGSIQRFLASRCNLSQSIVDGAKEKWIVSSRVLVSR